MSKIFKGTQKYSQLKVTLCVRVSYLQVNDEQFFDMNCRCGLAKRGQFVQQSLAKLRIVNGYEPNARPWMTYFQVNILQIYIYEHTRI